MKGVLNIFFIGLIVFTYSCKKETFEDVNENTTINTNTFNSSNQNHSNARLNSNSTIGISANKDGNEDKDLD